MAPLPDDLGELAAAVRNWGRWGASDQLGTLNLCDADAVGRGVAAVRDNQRFSLALPLSANGPQMGFIPRRENPVHDMVSVHMAAQPHDTPGTPGIAVWNDDAITMGTQACTHWDGLAHAAYDGHIYNGFPDSSVTAGGAGHCGVHLVGALAGRGVLLDVARALGVERLRATHPVTPEDLDAALELARTDLAPGDIVLVRTGHITRFHDGDRLAYATSAPGPTPDAARWFHRHDVAAVATDNLIFEVFPGDRDDIVLPLHFIHLVDMGLTQGQNWDLEELADACDADGRYTFLLSAPPEPIVAGVGAPVHPVAIR
jgi:kynurenine formamidase